MKSNDALIRTRYEETDKMGVIYHSNYYVYFEVGRAEFFRKLGYSYDRLEKDGIIMPVLETHCLYKKAAYYDDELLIRTRVSMFKGIKIELSYTVIRKNTDEVLAEGKTLHAFVDKTLKPVRIKTLNKEFLDILYSLI
ncbi:acyl-CoA thioesterase [Helicovermis profundi]|uniref:Thioesterase family protein n=1 Tax=Helicovermis profundi TaxID=3065157 RepID=A0AAU9ECP6_9FIRM|nr:thioesterase family protein [Clostridia bacterium S502]